MTRSNMAGAYTGNRYLPLEAREQEMLFEWAAYQLYTYPELQSMFAIPNGGSRHPAEARNLKRQGVKPGVPDICLPVPKGGYHGMYIEMKRLKGGRLSDDQSAWIAMLKRNGYRAVVCKGWKSARDAILDYLEERQR